MFSHQTLRSRRLRGVRTSLPPDDEITRLPIGYETCLPNGERAFPGAQRKRIALALVLARESRIVLLDKATSDLDAVTEHQIHERLRELRCTRIVVTYGLSGVRDANRIVVLENAQSSKLGRAMR